MSRATEILMKIRDRYVERITNFLTENEDELLDYANGDGYISVEPLFTAGEELRQISVILGCLPQEPQKYPEPDQVQVVVSEPISFSLWANQVRNGFYTASVASLSYLFNCDIPLAARCVHHFLNRLGTDPDAYQKIARLEQELLKGNLTECHSLLRECFGLQPTEAESVAASLKQLV